MKIKVTPNKVKKTASVCPECLQRIPARLVREGSEWYMKKTCPEHGNFKTIVWRGLPELTGWGSYKAPKEEWEDMPDCLNDCGLCSKHLQSTCCVLIEITSRCNLHCPVCFAESGDFEPMREKTPDELYEDFCAMTAANRRFIQLSGGEPTVRDDLPEIVAAAKRAGASSIQLNSNGLRLAAEPEFTKKLAEAGLNFVFMQFDGVSDEPYKKLRGRSLLEQKLEAIRVCGEAGLGVTLVPTVVPGVNDHEIGAIVKLAMENSPVVRGVHFQPVSYFGRYPQPPKDEDRITLPEILRAIEEQTEGLIKVSDIAPSACDHPRCGFHGDFVIMPDGITAITPKQQTSGDCCCSKTAEPDAEALRNRRFVARRWTRDLDAEQFEGDMDSFDGLLARIKSHGFTITAMAFQDAWNLDIERLRRCSLHVYRDGRIVPFCANYIKGD